MLVAILVGLFAIILLPMILAHFVVMISKMAIVIIGVMVALAVFKKTSKKPITINDVIMLLAGLALVIIGAQYLGVAGVV